jgi:hypothetical protein
VKVIRPVRLRYEGTDLQRLRVFELHNSSLEGVVGAVGHHSLHGAGVRIFAGLATLGGEREGAAKQQHRKTRKN